MVPCTSFQGGAPAREGQSADTLQQCFISLPSPVNPVSGLPDKGLCRRGLRLVWVLTPAVEEWRQVGGRCGLSDSQTQWDRAERALGSWCPRHSVRSESREAAGAPKRGLPLAVEPTLES